MDRLEEVNRLMVECQKLSQEAAFFLAKADKYKSKAEKILAQSDKRLLMAKNILDDFK